MTVDPGPAGRPLLPIAWRPRSGRRRALDIMARHPRELRTVPAPMAGLPHRQRRRCRRRGLDPRRRRSIGGHHFAHRPRAARRHRGARARSVLRRRIARGRRQRSRRRIRDRWIRRGRVCRRLTRGCRRHRRRICRCLIRCDHPDRRRRRICRRHGRRRRGRGRWRRNTARQGCGAQRERGDAGSPTKISHSILQTFAQRGISRSLLPEVETRRCADHSRPSFPDGFQPIFSRRTTAPADQDRFKIASGRRSISSRPIPAPNNRAANWRSGLGVGHNGRGSRHISRRPSSSDRPTTANSADRASGGISARIGGGG